MLALTQGLMSLGTAAPSVQEWNLALASPLALIDTSNRRIRRASSGSGTVGNARATRACVGNCYFSIAASGADFTFNGRAGLVDQTVDIAADSVGVGDNGQGALGAGMEWSSGTVRQAGSSAGSAGTLILPSTIEIAVRTSSRRVWFRAAGGGWVGGGSPVADTSPTLTLGGTGQIFAAASIFSGFGAAVIHHDAASTTGAVPSGFTAANWA